MIILLLFSFSILIQTMQFKPRVNISQGIVEGVILRTKNRRDFSAFIGIPYGEPPVGELRFSSPVLIKKWVGTYLADNENFQIKCPQFDSDEVIGQEDCLYLNVFTPLTKFNLSNPINNSRFPVMLWIHGGAFVFGSNSFNEYGPKYFLDKDIVLVIINALSSCAYRDKTNFKIDVERVAKNVDCPMVNSTIMIKCLRNVNFKNLLKASKFYKSKKPELIWTPTNEIASKDAFLTDSPQNLVRQNKIKKYPFISGVVADEGLYVTADFLANKSIEPLEKGFENSINLAFKQYGTFKKREEFEKIIENYYFNNFTNYVNNNYEQHYKLLKNLTKFVSDSMFLYPDEILMNKLAKVTETPFYRYKFGYRGTMNRIYLAFGLKENFGVGHSNELLYLFNYGSLFNNISQHDEHIVNVMIDLWTSFAIVGLSNYQMASARATSNNFGVTKESLSYTDMSIAIGKCITGYDEGIYFHCRDSNRSFTSLSHAIAYCIEKLLGRYYCV